MANNNSNNGNNNRKSSKDIARQATNNLDPNIAKIAKTTDAIASTLSQQSSAIQQLKQSIVRSEEANNEANKQIVSSLQMAGATLNAINSNLTSINKNISSVTSVVSGFSANANTTSSLLGGIQTSLVQITSVLAAFRSDYLLASNGNKPDGHGYYDMQLLRNLTNSLRGINNPTLKKQLLEISKAANYANKASNSVRSRIGNHSLSKDEDELGIFDKIVNGANTVKSYAGLAALLSSSKNDKISRIGKKAELISGKNIESVSDILELLPFMGDKTNALKELGMKFGESNNPLLQMLSGYMGKAGYKQSRKEREKDPNLVMSSLAPFADDIKDMVEMAYKGVTSRPKVIPNYAKPVWVVNSPDQKNYIDMSKGTLEKELQESRLLAHIEGRANNTKDVYGRELFTRDGNNKIGGIAARNISNRVRDKLRQQGDARIEDINFGNLRNNRFLNNISNTLTDENSLFGNPVLGSLVAGIVPTIFGSHKGGKKGKRRRRSKGYRDEYTREHQKTFINQDTTIYNESDVENSKSNYDILSGQLTVASGLSALVDIYSQENIYLSQAVNNGKIDTKQANKYTSSFASLEKVANEVDADQDVKKSIGEYKKISNLSKLITPAKSKKMTTSELLGRDPEESSEGGNNKSLVGTLLDKLGITNKLTAGKNTIKRVKEKITNKLTGGVKKKIAKTKAKLKNFGKDKIKGLKDKALGKKDSLTNKIKNSTTSIGDKFKNSRFGKSKLGSKITSASDELKKMYNEELKKTTEEGAKEAADAAKVAAEKQKNAVEQMKAEKTALDQRLAAENAAAVERDVAKSANDKVIMAEEAAADKAEIVQDETAAAAQNAAQMTSLQAQQAVEVAGTEGTTAMGLSGVIKNVATKMCGLPFPVKIGLGLAGLAGVTALGAKIIKKVKEASKGKKSSSGSTMDVLSSSAASASKEQKKASKAALSEQEKLERKEKRKAKLKRGAKSLFNSMTFGIFAQKVFVDESGNVLYSKDKSPVKALDANGDETEETLNIKTKEGKKQFLKRLVAREFKLDKARSVLGALNKLTNGKLNEKISKAKEKVKDQLDKAKKRAKRNIKSMANIATLGLFAQKVYVNENGDVLYSKDDSPVLKLDKFGNETEETLNTKTLSGKAQLASRLLAREFKLDKAKLAKKVLKNVKSSLSGTIDNAKEKFNKLKDRLTNVKDKAKDFVKNHKGEIIAGAVGGVAGIAAYEVVKKNKKALTSIKDKTANKMNQLLTMASSSFLFMDDRLKKQVEKVSNSDFGRKLTENPEKASNLLFNVASGGVATVLSTTKDAMSGIKSVLDNVVKKITGEDDHKDKLSSDLSDMGTESATLAYARANRNNNTNAVLNAFAKALGFSATATGENGRVMTTSKIVNEARKAKAIQVGVVGMNGYAGNNNALMSNATNSAIANKALSLIGKTRDQIGLSGDFAWCAATVSKVFSDLGINMHDYSCTSMVKQMKNSNEWTVHNSTPEPGDIIFFDWDKSGDQDHVGIVVGFDAATNTITYVNGNGDSPTTVTQQTMQYGDSNISCFGRYMVGAANSVATPAEKATKKVVEGENEDKTSKATTGKGRYGRVNLRGGKASTPGHIYQRDYSGYTFNTKNDKTLQTLGDSGCGPAAAVNLKKYYKGMGKSRRRFGGDNEEENDKKNEKTENKAEPSAIQKDANVLGRTSSYTDSYGNEFSVTIEQEHIDIFNRCKSVGCSDAAACGVLGNLHQETGGSGERLQYWASNHTQYGGGIMQWTPWTKHVEWSESRGLSPWTWEANLAHMEDELRNGGNWSNPQNADPPMSTEGYTACSSTAEWMALTDPAAAAANFERAFEVSGDWNGRNSEGIVYAESALRDRKRVGPAICYYECLVGTYTGSVASIAGISGNNIGYINLITDSAVDSSVFASYASGESVWDKRNKAIEEAKATASNTSTESGSGRYGRGSDGVSFKNANFELAGDTSSAVSLPTSTASNNNSSVVSSSTPSTAPSISSYISNKMTVDDEGKTTTNVYTGNNKTTLETNGKSTIVICNNFTEKTRTDLSDILSNFKHLNGTQNNALKVLKAISDLIKEEDPNLVSEITRLKLSNEGLDYILKGL